MAHRGLYPTTGGWIKPIAGDTDKVPSVDRYPSKTFPAAKIKKAAKK